MTTTRQKALMLAAIFGLSAVCGWEAMELHAWNTLAFGAMAVACAVMFAWQVGEERRAPPLDIPFRWQWRVPHRRFWLQVIRSSRGWTWRVKR